MSAALSAFDYIASIIPGAIFLYGISWLCPDWKIPFLQQNTDLGSLSIFLIIALIAGQLLEALGRYALECPMTKLGLVRQSTKIMCSTENREGIGHKLGKNMEDICKSENHVCLSAVLGDIISKESKSSGHSRVELFEDRYYMHLDLATAFLLLAIISVTHTPHSCPTTAFLLFALGLSLERAHHYDGLYARELFRSFLLTD
jgi:hypothetical protein